MPKLLSLKPRELIKKLNKLGFIKHHQEGSHLTMKHPSGRRAVIAMHTKDIKKGTLNSLLNEAGVSREEIGR